MSKIKNIIDFEIIWKKLHNVISKDEENILKKWISEENTHSEYYKNAENYYSKGSTFDEKPENISTAWKNVASKLQYKRKFGIKHLAYLSIAASIVLMLALVFNWNNDEPKIANLTENVIEQGEKKAKLILDNGTEYELLEGKDLLIEESGVQIKSNGTTIEYNSAKNESATLRYNTIIIPRGGEFSLKLSDGSRVWLNSETTFKYPLWFNENERKVSLSGEAYFEVVKNVNAPFRVQSGIQMVEVLGTSFNVSSYEEDSIIFTTLVEGKVSVSSLHNPEVKQTLNPNNQSLLIKNEGIINKRKVEAYKYTAWKDGRFYFKDERLSQIMKTLSRWYNVEVIFETQNAKEMKFTGDLKRYEKIEKILSKIEKTNEVKFELKDKIIRVK
ncbi:MAG: DUF4974 domain-containing protein [Bacteroidales bacterium]|nr:DUF4974 domain-containing protein [Bacteroidales bacterium]